MKGLLESTNGLSLKAGIVLDSMAGAGARGRLTLSPQIAPLVFNANCLKPLELKSFKQNKVLASRDSYK